MQLMVYVGGTLVLLIFGVMLTARGPFVQMTITPGQWALAAIVGGSLLAVLLQAAFSVKGWNSGRLRRGPARPGIDAGGPDRSGALGRACPTVWRKRIPCCGPGCPATCWPLK